MQSSIDIGNIIEEISDTLKEKLINVFNPIINEKKTVESLLLNMPSIQGIIKENEYLKEKNRKLEQTIQELKNKYKQTFLETSYQQTHLIKNNSSNKNITLEIEELNNCSINISKSDIVNNYDDNSDSLSDIVLNDMLSKKDYNCELVDPKQLIENVEKEKERYALRARNNYAKFYKKSINEVTLSDVMNSSAGIKTWHDSEICERSIPDNSDSENSDSESEYSDSNSIVNKDQLFSLDNSHKINPFPPNSQEFYKFNNNEQTIPIEKAYLVWSTLNKYPSDEVKEAYPDVEWNKAEEILKKSESGQHNYWENKEDEDEDEEGEEKQEVKEEKKEEEEVEEEEVEEEEVEEEEVEEEEVEEEEVEEVEVKEEKKEEEEEEEEVEEEEEEVEEEEVEEEEEEEEVEQEVEEEEEITLVETIINGTVYYTDNIDIYDEDDEIVGKFVDGKPEFS